MRILFIGPEVRNREGVNSFGTLWAHYWLKELRALGVETAIVPRPANMADVAQLPLEGIQHVCSLGQRYLDQVPAEYVQRLRSRFNGTVTQLAEATRSTATPVHATFCIRGEAFPGHVSLGWAADPETCLSGQSSTELGILVDHPYYGTRMRDHSEAIFKQIYSLKRATFWRSKFKSIRVTRIVDGGFEEVTTESPAIPAYTRKHVPYEEMCKVYSKAHLFMVTHNESVGQAALESAMAGALPLVPTGCIAPVLLRTIRAVTYSGAVPWMEALNKIDPQASREKAMSNSWQRVAQRAFSWWKEQPCTY